MAASDVIDVFLARAAAQPQATAVAQDGERVSYGALEQAVRRLATSFARRPAPRVLIALPQGAMAYAAMLAAGLCGGWYTPLNLEAPIEKLRHIASLVQPDIIVAEPALAAILAAEANDPLIADPDHLPTEPFLERGTRHELAYVLFTSGSTGVPKGVMIPRAGLDHYVAWLLAALDLRRDDRVSQHPNIAFDLSVMGIYGGLCAGAAVHPVIGQGNRLLPARFIEREKITVWISVPSVVSQLLRAHEATAEKLGSVRLFVFCGEPLLRVHLDALFGACPMATIFNTYGPTEATVSMTALELTARDYAYACDTSVSIGAAIPGMGLHLVGGRHADEGELVLTGPQLAMGYWQDEARTAQSFRDVTVGGETLRGYFTGDWAERRGSHVFFSERLDFQVKVHGFRVELDEVAEAIRGCGWPVVCVFKYGEALVAMVERVSDRAFDETALRAALSTKLESHAVPSHICSIEHMPRNENDKLDRRAVIDHFEAMERARAPLPQAP